MTTAAPPEKMKSMEKRLKRLRWGIRQIIDGESSINEDFKTFARMLVTDDEEAARRLSAPAVRDDGCREGWVMVPRVPTYAMVNAPERPTLANCNEHHYARAWEAMLKAVPLVEDDPTHPASAPAPAAPRVGDDVRESLPLIIEICDAAFHIVDDSEVDNGLKETPVFTVDLTRLRKAVEAAEVAEVYIHGEPDDDDVLRRALSAPPAASADEREEFAKDIHEAEFGDPFDSLPEPEKEINRRIAGRLNALGYRKLAPAQSVGQSAAQGEP